MQHEFVRELARWCKEQKIHIAIETTAFAERSVFLDAMQHIDFAFIDVATWIRRGIREDGRAQRADLGNIAALAQSDWQGRRSSGCR